MEAEISQPKSTEEFKWNMLTKALHNDRCVLFLGPFLPLYSHGDAKFDFYSLVSLHLAEELMGKGDPFDHTQSQNISYIAQKYVMYNNNYRASLDDVISPLYSALTQSMIKEQQDSIPPLYRTLLQLPWHTIINMQPDSYFSGSLKPDEAFAYYNYKGGSAYPDISENKLLVFNLFGAIVSEKKKYKVDSLVLTEEDQVEFVRNLVKGDPRIPDNILSRFDNDKIYIFLDCNLENWYFRLLMEILNIHKDSHAFSPSSKLLHLTSSTIEFYRKRYGFVFINNNSEEFVNKFHEEYYKEFPVKEHLQKRVFIAYHETSDALMKSLVSQFAPWVERNELSVWCKEQILPGDETEEVLNEQFNKADVVLMLINARFLNDKENSNVRSKAIELNPDKQYFAILESACAWDQGELKKLQREVIFPSDFVPIKVQQQQDPDKIVYEVVKSITNAIWE